MIEVKYVGRFGNNLFQYCLGRILASELGYALKADPIEGFPNTSEKIIGIDNSALPAKIYSGQKIDLESIIADPSLRHIVLEGYFQNYYYYTKYREQIRRHWLQMDVNPSYDIDDTDMVLHIRRGDYVSKYYWAALPWSFYEDIITNNEYSRLFICTDSPKDKFIQRICEKYGAIVHHKSMLEDFRFITQFKKIVLSQSTYAWWAAYLSNASEIFFPIAVTGYWSPGSEIDIAVYEPRYKYVQCRETYQLSLREIVKYYRTPPKKFAYHLLQHAKHTYAKALKSSTR